MSGTLKVYYFPNPFNRIPINMTDSAARVGFASAVTGTLFHRFAGLCRRLADLESRLLRDEISDIDIRAPVFICGLARSGTTVILEALASTGRFASLRYCDYPPVWFPWWWTRLRDRLPLPRPAPVQRAHGDGIEVTPESPEAFDEIFWMHFFPDRHAEDVDQVLDERTDNPAFEAFYSRHIRKLLLARQRSRYLSKGNYGLARLAYLYKLFPDARFVVPVRDPVDQVASLVRQNKHFRQLSDGHRAIGRELARRGHFEFGPQLRVECLNDASEAAGIARDYRQGHYVRGYARQWVMSYGHVLAQLSNRPGLAEAVLVLRYEDLCADPASTLEKLAGYCQLDDESGALLAGDWQARIDHSRPGVQDGADAELVRDICRPVARKLGYDGSRD